MLDVIRFSFIYWCMFYDFKLHNVGCYKIFIYILVYVICFSVVRKLQDFESPFISLKSANKDCVHRIVLRKRFVFILHIQFFYAAILLEVSHNTMELV